MAAFQPIEDTGPSLALGIFHFLRVFVTAASPLGFQWKTLRTKTVLGLFQPFKRNPEQDGTMVISNLFGRQKGSGKFFNWMDLKPEPESEKGFRGQEVFVTGTGSSIDPVTKLVLAFPGMPAEEDFEISGPVPHPDHPSVT